MFMTHLVGGIAGLVFGAIVGYVKFALLWKGKINKKTNISMRVVYRNMAIGYAFNFAALLFVFLLRNVMPCDFMWPLLGTAVSLSIAARLAPMQEVMKLVEDKKYETGERDE